MSQFSFSCNSFSDWSNRYWSSCSGKTKERQQKSEEKLRQQMLVQQYQLNETERKITEVEAKKVALMKIKRIREAKDAVREKHKLLAKMTKQRELLDFTEHMLVQITDSVTMKETIATLDEAKSVFQSIDAPKLHRRFDKFADTFQTFQTSMDDTREIMNERLGPPQGGPEEDAELLAELAALDFSAVNEEPSMPVYTVIGKPVDAPPVGQRAASAYAAAGLV